MLPGAENMNKLYVTPITNHDPSGLPITGNVKLVENTEITRIGDGIWKTATGGPGGFSIYMADPCQRRENGSITANDQTRTQEEAAQDDFSIFVHDGEPSFMEIKGVPGVTERANNWGPFDLPAAHIFKIKNGQICDIEAIGYIAEHGINNGWE